MRARCAPRSWRSGSTAKWVLGAVVFAAIGGAAGGVFLALADDKSSLAATPFAWIAAGLVLACLVLVRVAATAARSLHRATWIGRLLTHSRTLWLLAHSLLDVADGVTAADYTQWMLQGLIAAVQTGRELPLSEGDQKTLQREAAWYNAAANHTEALVNALEAGLIEVCADSASVIAVRQCTSVIREAVDVASKASSTGARLPLSMWLIRALVAGWAVTFPAALHHEQASDAFTVAASAGAGFLWGLLTEAGLLFHPGPSAWRRKDRLFAERDSPPPYARRDPQFAEAPDPRPAAETPAAGASARSLTAGGGSRVTFEDARTAPAADARARDAPSPEGSEVRINVSQQPLFGGERGAVLRTPSPGYAGDWTHGWCEGGRGRGIITPKDDHGGEDDIVEVIDRATQVDHPWRLDDGGEERLRRLASIGPDSNVLHFDSKEPAPEGLSLRQIWFAAQGAADNGASQSSTAPSPMHHLLPESPDASIFNNTAASATYSRLLTGHQYSSFSGSMTAPHAAQANPLPPPGGLPYVKSQASTVPAWQEPTPLRLPKGACHMASDDGSSVLPKGPDDLFDPVSVHSDGMQSSDTEPRASVTRSPSKKGDATKAFAGENNPLMQRLVSQSDAGPAEPARSTLFDHTSWSAQRLASKNLNAGMTFSDMEPTEPVATKLSDHATPPSAGRGAKVQSTRQAGSSGIPSSSGRLASKMQSSGRADSYELEPAGEKLAGRTPSSSGRLASKMQSSGRADSYELEPAGEKLAGRTPSSSGRLASKMQSSGRADSYELEPAGEKLAGRTPSSSGRLASKMQSSGRADSSELEPAGEMLAGRLPSSGTGRLAPEAQPNSGANSPEAKPPAPAVEKAAARTSPGTLRTQSAAIVRGGAPGALVESPPPGRGGAAQRPPSAAAPNPFEALAAARKRSALQHAAAQNGGNSPKAGTQGLPVTRGRTGHLHASEQSRQLAVDRRHTAPGSLRNPANTRGSAGDRGGGDGEVSFGREVYPDYYSTIDLQPVPSIGDMVPAAAALRDRALEGLEGRWVSAKPAFEFRVAADGVLRTADDEGRVEFSCRLGDAADPPQLQATVQLRSAALTFPATGLLGPEAANPPRLAVTLTDGRSTGLISVAKAPRSEPLAISLSPAPSRQFSSRSPEPSPAVHSPTSVLRTQAGIMSPAGIIADYSADNLESLASFLDGAIIDEPSYP
ncbi:hypothetical protein DIPPA_02674 [Diplonema papillatum]|nr:hypothetical protein DIPPA_02674 [Diplonema papillatum]